MNKTDIKIREAKIEEINILKSFEQAIIKHERQFAPNLREDPIEYYDLASLILNEEAQVLVATIDELIVGSGYGLIKNSVPYKKPAKYLYLGFMYVLPKFRGMGINGEIIDNLMSWGKKRNLTEVQLEVYAHNEMAINAYTKRKFKADILRMRLDTEE